MQNLFAALHMIEAPSDRNCHTKFVFAGVAAPRVSNASTRSGSVFQRPVELLAIATFIATCVL
jgi:hypothetical protein